MANRIKVERIKEFSKLVSDGVTDYFGGKDIDGELIVEYLARHGLIRPGDVRDYLILNEYPQLLARPGKTSYDAVIDLAQKFDVSERTVQYKIYNSRKKYLPQSNVTA